MPSYKNKRVLQSSKPDNLIPGMASFSMKMIHYFTFLLWLNPPLYGGYPKICTGAIVIGGIKEGVKTHMSDLKEQLNFFVNLTTIFLKFWTLLYMGSSPKNGAATIALEEIKASTKTSQPPNF